SGIFFQEILRRLGVNRTGDDFVSVVIFGPGNGQLLVAKKSRHGQNEKSQRRHAPLESVSRLSPALSREKNQAENNDDDKLAEAKPHFILAGRDAHRRREQESAENSAEPQRSLRHGHSAFARLSQPFFYVRTRRHF